MATQAVTTFQQLIKSDAIQNRLADVFGGKEVAKQTAAIISMYNQNPTLKQCDPGSVISAAVQAALIKLPLSSQLGYAYVVPYGQKNDKKAQLQIGYKGFIQLAERSGQYSTINAGVVYEGQLKDFNYVTGEFELGEPASDEVVGYFAYFRLNNGFRKMLYMTREQIEAHADKYSQSYKKSYGVWKDNFDAMATKTVLKLLISKYGVISIEMQQAVAADQAVITKYDFVYPDNGNGKVPRDSTITVDAVEATPAPIDDTPDDDESVPWEDNEVDSDTGEVTNFFDN